MTRQIKFRVWNGAQKKWEHGPGDECNLFGEMILLGGFMRVRLEELNDCIPCQFIGMKDKNGREIYEGDILNGFNQRFVIEYGIARRSMEQDSYQVDIPCFYFRNIYIEGSRLFPIVKNGGGRHDLE